MDNEYCPLCGSILIESKSGIWCVNPDCEVTDDYCMYEPRVTKGGKGSGNFGHVGRPGQLGGSGGGGGSAHAMARDMTRHIGMIPVSRDKDGKIVMPDGGKPPAHIPLNKIAPAWTELMVHPNPKADWWALGRDSKNRLQGVQNPEFAERRAVKKWKAVDEIFDIETDPKRSITGKIKKDLKDGVSVEEAACLQLIMDTALRPGSTKDTKADKQAYGATTLLGKHVKIVNGEVRLQFVAKEGISQDLAITDKSVGADVLKRKKSAGNNGKIFDTSDDKVLAYGKEKGLRYTKDLRTYVGTKTGIEAMVKIGKEQGHPANEKEYKRMVKEVGIIVGAKLGNTPNMALKTYINPVIFTIWRKNAHVTDPKKKWYRGEGIWL